MHDIVKRGSKDYYCTVCRQSWTAPSKAYCPDMIVIPYDQRGRLMSKTELGKRGYKNGADDLPEATCCYRMTTGNVDVLYVKLYDPELCTPKKQRKHKTVHYAESLHWPKAWFLFLEDIYQWQIENKKGEQARVWRSLCLEVARMTSPLLFFTPDEITAMAGETVEFKFPLTPIRTQWNERNVSSEQAETLVDLLVYAYRDWQWKNRPPLTEEQHEQRRLKQEARERAERYALEQMRAKLFEPPDWLTSQEVQSPAIQLSLFDLQ